MLEFGTFRAPGPGRSSADSRRVLSLALALGLTLGACSTLSDMGEATTEGVSKAANAMNPFNWFGDSEEDDAQARAKQERAVANSEPKTGVKSAPRDSLAQRSTERDEERYPKLSSVPDRPREVASKQADRSRQELRKGLVADTENAQYTDNELRAQTSPTSGARQVDSARSNERLAGEPPAAPSPTIPVTAAPADPMTRAEARPQAIAAATPRVVPPPVSTPAPAPRRSSYGARQAAAASAAPVAPAAPSASSAPLPARATTPAPPAPQRQAALAQPAPEPAAPEPRTVLKTVQVATIYFNSGSSRLSPTDKRIVEQIADVARRTGGMLRIIGHSSMAAAGRDSERAAMVNYTVSLERANAVASELLQQGIPGNQMQVMAEGARNPIYAESSATGTAGNRRTEIYLDFYERR